MNTLIWTILCVLVFVTQTGCGAPPTTPPGGLSIPSIAADPNSGVLLPPEGNSGPLDPNPPGNGPDSGQNGPNPGGAGGGSGSGDSGAAGDGGGSTPPPDPGPLSCYVNNGVFCTGGNVQNGPVQIDVNTMFLGNNSTLQIIQASVTNGNNATQTQICSQPNGAGCHANSACITVVIHVNGTNQTFPPVMSCGNAVNPVTHVLQML